MPTPYLLSENFFNSRQFPSHTLTGEDEATGYEVWRVANGRRHSRDYYTPDTSNAGRYVQVQCDRVRSADMMVIDRNSNLSGETVRLWVSNQSAFTTYEEYTFTVPSSAYAANELLDEHPVRTDEGAIIFRFPETAGIYWRLEVDAMGAGERPQIGGLWVGKSFQPQTTPLPWDDEPRWLERQTFRTGSPSSYSESGRQTSLRVMLKDDAEWTQARYHISERFWRGDLMWYVPDGANAERAWLAYSPGGTNGAPFTDRPQRDMDIAMVEHQPERK
jgi:hypothetical protein